MMSAPSPSITRSSLSVDFRRDDAHAVEWKIETGPVPYEDAVVFMENRVKEILEGNAPELAWLLEHPALITAGTSAKEDDLLQPGRFPVHRTGRGGQFTYHGPGQRVAYVMLDLSRRKKDVRAFVAALEAWMIATLAEMNIHGRRREDRVGVWVERPAGRAQATDGAIAEDKIAALGIRLKKWVSLHGISINVDPDLSHFEAIVPCGVSDHGVTSLLDLGHVTMMSEVDAILKTQFETIFGPTRLPSRSA